MLNDVPRKLVTVAIWMQSSRVGARTTANLDGIPESSRRWRSGRS
jgi:hypothetical protein